MKKEFSAYHVLSFPWALSICHKTREERKEYKSCKTVTSLFCVVLRHCIKYFHFSIFQITLSYTNPWTITFYILLLYPWLKICQERLDISSQSQHSTQKLYAGVRSSKHWQMCQSVYLILTHGTAARASWWTRHGARTQCGNCKTKQMRNRKYTNVVMEFTP